MHDDPVVAIDTINRLARMEQEDNILVLVAHDKLAQAVLPPFPTWCNDWLETGLKKRIQALEARGDGET